MLPGSRASAASGLPRRKQIFPNEDVEDTSSTISRGSGRGRLNRMDQPRSPAVGLPPGRRGVDSQTYDQEDSQTLNPRQRARMSRMGSGVPPPSSNRISSGRRSASNTGELPPPVSRDEPSPVSGGPYIPMREDVTSGRRMVSNRPAPSNRQRITGASISERETDDVQSFPRPRSRQNVVQPSPVSKVTSSSMRATNQPPPVSQVTSSSSSRASGRRTTSSRNKVNSTALALPSAVTQSRKQVSGPTPAASRMLVSKTSLEESNEMDKLVYQLIVNHIRGDKEIYTDPLAEFENIKEDMKNKLTDWSNLPEDRRNILWNYNFNEENVKDMLDIYTSIDEDDERNALIKLILRRCVGGKDTEECDILPHLKDKSIEWVRWLVGLSNRDFYEQIDRMNVDKDFNRTIPIPPKPSTHTYSRPRPSIPSRPSTSQPMLEYDEEIEYDEDREEESGSIVEEENEDGFDQETRVIVEGGGQLGQEYIDTIQDTLIDVDLEDLSIPENVEDPEAWLLENVKHRDLNLLEELSKMNEEELHVFFLEDMQKYDYK